MTKIINSIKKPKEVCDWVAKVKKLTPKQQQKAEERAKRLAHTESLRQIVNKIKKE